MPRPTPAAGREPTMTSVLSVRRYLSGPTALWVVLFVVAFGTNVPTPLLLVYRDTLGLSATALTGAFGLYAAGLVPMLLLAGPASDRFGRRRLVVPASLLAALTSLLFLLAGSSVAALFAGRFLQGAVSGVVFSVGSAWLGELVGAPARAARLTTAALSAGWGLGPLTAGGLAGRDRRVPVPVDRRDRAAAAADPGPAGHRRRGHRDGCGGDPADRGARPVPASPAPGREFRRDRAGDRRRRAGAEPGRCGARCLADPRAGFPAAWGRVRAVSRGRPHDGVAVGGSCGAWCSHRHLLLVRVSRVRRAAAVVRDRRGRRARRTAGRADGRGHRRRRP